jgi:hypothetical protein
MHLGNLLIRTMNDFERLDELRVGNRDDLDGLLDTEPYLAATSDIVALLVFQHQLDVQNLITRVNYDARTAFAAMARGEISAMDAQAHIAEPVEDLLHTMLFVDAVEYTEPIAGVAAFQRQFNQRAVRDSQGRSLRDFDLTRRLFRYPLSYLVHSTAFDALPVEAKQLFFGRLAAVLRGTDTSAEFAHLAPVERSAVLEILRDTHPEFARSLAN